MYAFIRGTFVTIEIIDHWRYRSATSNFCFFYLSSFFFFCYHFQIRMKDVFASYRLKSRLFQEERIITFSKLIRWTENCGFTPTRKYGVKLSSFFLLHVFSFSFHSLEKKFLNSRKFMRERGRSAIYLSPSLLSTFKLTGEKFVLRNARI